MLGRTGLRFALETLLIVATAAIAGFAHLDAGAIVGAVVVVWLASSAFEYSRSHPRSGKARRAPDGEALELHPEPAAPLESVRVLTGSAAARPAREPRFELEPGWEAEGEPAPVAVIEREPAIEPEPEREPELEPLPGPDPDHVPPRDPTPARDSVAPAPVVAAPTPAATPAAASPWSWNIWNLERVVRERASTNEELSFLLLYLRDYASPSGMLPPDFDALVRESFGDLLAAPS